MPPNDPPSLYLQRFAVSMITSGVFMLASSLCPHKRWSLGFLQNVFCQSALALTVVGCVLLPGREAVAAASAGEQAAARANNIGVAYMNQQLTEKALQKFVDARQADAAAVTPLINEGLAYLYLRKLPEAEESLRKATTLDPASVRAWYGLGVTHFSGGNQDAALEAFKHALALDPKDPDVQYFVGTIYLSQKRYDDAVGDFNAALSVSPLHASAQFGLARALQREGKLDEAREHLKRFQEITQSKIGMLMSASYGEQGRYATVQDMLAPPASAGPMIPVKFVAGVSAATTSTTPAGSTGAGACAFDLEGNGSRDLVAMTSGDGFRSYHVAEDGSLKLLPVDKTNLAARGDGVSCAVGDFDNDGLPDLAVAMTDRVLLFHNLGHGRFADLTEKVGIKALNRPAGITFVDFDHDGDLDLFVTGSATSAGSSVLWRNNGNSTFTEWTTTTGLGGTASTVGAVLTDINNDRAVDLVVDAAKGSPSVYENQREGAFKQVVLYNDAQLPPTRGIVTADLNKDGFMDVALTHAGAPGISIWRNVRGEHFERVDVALQGVKAAWGVTPVDFDNDGWIDLAVVVEGSSGAELRVLRNEGAKGFVDVSDALGLHGLALGDARSVIAADIDHDGAADLLISRSNDLPVVLRNVGGSKNHSLRIDLTGLADNKSAIGTKVEVFSDGNWQKFEVAGASGYMGQGSMEILAGLGASERADVVRLLWPTGVPQDELNLATNEPLALTELDRRGSSCPVLFA